MKTDFVVMKRNGLLQPTTGNGECCAQLDQLQIQVNLEEIWLKVLLEWLVTSILISLPRLCIIVHFELRKSRLVDRLRSREVFKLVIGHSFGNQFRFAPRSSNNFVQEILLMARVRA